MLQHAPPRRSVPVSARPAGHSGVFRPWSLQPRAVLVRTPGSQPVSAAVTVTRVADAARRDYPGRVVDPRGLLDRLPAAQNARDVDAMGACLHDDYRSEQPLFPARTFQG